MKYNKQQEDNILSGKIGTMAKTKKPNIFTNTKLDREGNNKIKARNKKQTSKQLATI